MCWSGNERCLADETHLKSLDDARAEATGCVTLEMADIPRSIARLLDAMACGCAQMAAMVIKVSRPSSHLRGEACLLVAVGSESPHLDGLRAFGWTPTSIYA